MCVKKLNKGFEEYFRVGKGKIRGRRLIRRANKKVTI